MRQAIGWATVVASVLVTGCGAKSTPEAATKPGAEVGPIQPADGKLDVLCSFFPMYLFTKAVVGERANVTVSLMLPAELGCPHDYDLQPSDVKRIQEADLFVLNGAGLETFAAKQVTKANPKIVVVDSSAGIEPLQEEEEHDHSGHDHDEHAHHDHAHDHDHDHGHDHGGGNPHFFSGPAQAAAQVKNIAAALAAADPAGAADYQKNAAAYADSLGALTEEFHRAAGQFANKRIVTMHEVFDYLARDCGLEIVATIQSNPGHEPSATEMRRVIEKIKSSGAAAVFIEPQYSAQVAQTVAKDAGVPVHTLDPIASGPPDAAPNYYLKKMRENLDVLKGALAAPSAAPGG